jgi:hypothetical protein
MRLEWYQCGVFPAETTAEKLTESVRSALSLAGFLVPPSLVSFSLRPLSDGNVAVSARLPPHLLWVLNHLPAPVSKSLSISRLVPTQRWCSCCLRKGHTASACKAKPRCTRCGSEEHLLRTCPQARGSCLACGSSSHLFHRCFQVRGTPKPVTLPVPPAELADNVPDHSPYGNKVPNWARRLKLKLQQLTEEVAAKAAALSDLEAKHKDLLQASRLGFADVSYIFGQLLSRLEINPSHIRVRWEIEGLPVRFRDL